MSLDPGVGRRAVGIPSKWGGCLWDLGQKRQHGWVGRPVGFAASLLLPHLLPPAQGRPLICLPSESEAVPPTKAPLPSSLGVAATPEFLFENHSCIHSVASVRVQ